MSTWHAAALLVSPLFPPLAIVVVADLAWRGMSRLESHLPAGFGDPGLPGRLVWDGEHYRRIA